MCAVRQWTNEEVTAGRQQIPSVPVYTMCQTISLGGGLPAFIHERLWQLWELRPLPSLCRWKGGLTCHEHLFPRTKLVEERRLSQGLGTGPPPTLMFSPSALTPDRAAGATKGLTFCEAATVARRNGHMQSRHGALYVDPGLALHALLPQRLPLPGAPLSTLTTFRNDGVLAPVAFQP